MTNLVNLDLEQMQQMDLFKPSDLRELIRHTDDPCVSVYLPTHESGDDTREDSIRLKNILNYCKDHLEGEYSQIKVDGVLGPGFELLDKNMFWSHQSRGLALYMSPSSSQFFRLPLRPEEETYFGKRFHVLPLIPAVARDKAFYILAVSQNEVRFFQADDNEIHELELPDIPKRLDDMLWKEGYTDEQHVQVHSTPAGKSTGNDATYHGHGNIADERRHKKMVEEFINEVAKGVDKRLDGQKAPLVLAGVEFVRTFYRQHSSYKNVMKEGIDAKFKQLNIRKLHDEAWSLVEPNIHKETEECLGRYMNLVNSELTSTEIREIVPAAEMDRIDTLLVDINKQVTGIYNKDLREVSIKVSDKTDVEDLLNLAVIYSIENRARVCPISSEKIGAPAAAIFRH